MVIENVTCFVCSCTGRRFAEQEMHIVLAKVNANSLTQTPVTCIVLSLHLLSGVFRNLKGGARVYTVHFQKRSNYSIFFHIKYWHNFFTSKIQNSGGKLADLHTYHYQLLHKNVSFQ